jgi:hypothetical protein
MAICNAWRLKLFFFSFAAAATVAGSVLMFYGLTEIFTVSYADALGSSSGTPDFSYILQNFTKCTQAANAYSALQYDSNINDLIQFQACTLQSGPVFFMAVAAVFLVITSIVSSYTFFKESSSSFYLCFLHQPFTVMLIIIGIYVILAATDETVAHCPDCSGFSSQDQVNINSNQITALPFTKCRNGVAGNNPGVRQFLLGIACYYAGSALGLVSLVIFQWLVVYAFSHRSIKH